MERSNGGGEVFGEGYFLRGEGSNYISYRWLPDLSLPMVDHLKRHLHIQTGDDVYDYGCALGFIVKALRLRGVNAWGYDISRWAVENADEAVKPYVSNSLVVNQLRYDHIIAKDVMEHLQLSELEELIPKLCNATKKSILIIVPLCAYRNGRYLRDEDEKDATHVIRYTLTDWLLFLTPLAPDFTVSGSYHIKGLKPASIQVPQSCGFFTLTRSSP